MQKKLTITIDERVYNGLYRVVGAGKISQFIERIVKPHVVGQDLDDVYAQMSRDEHRETRALDWSEDLIGDVEHETR